MLSDWLTIGYPRARTVRGMRPEAILRPVTRRNGRTRVTYRVHPVRTPCRPFVDHACSEHSIWRMRDACSPRRTARRFGRAIKRYSAGMEHRIRLNALKGRSIPSSSMCIRHAEIVVKTTITTPMMTPDRPERLCLDRPTVVREGTLDPRLRSVERKPMGEQPFVFLPSVGIRNRPLKHQWR